MMEQAWAVLAELGYPRERHASLTDAVEALRDTLATEAFVWNGRWCPYYARFYCLPGYDPEVGCTFGCREEPSCVTDEPTDGWPPLAPPPPDDPHDD